MKVFIILFITVLHADFGGGYAGSEFRYASNARDLALSKSNSANGSIGYFQFSNPAQLSQIKAMDISSSFMSLPLDRSIQTLTFSKPLPPFAGIAFSIYRSATADIERRTNMNEYIENFDIANYMGMLSFGIKPFNKLAFGLNIKKYFIPFKSDTAGNGISIDLGLRFSFIDKIKLSLKLENVFSELNWEIKDDAMQKKQSIETYPFNIIMGGVYENSNLKFYYQQDFINVDNTSLFYYTRLGSEYFYGSLILRLGLYQNRYEFVNDTKNDFNFIPTFGLGLILNDKFNLPIKLDYALDTGRAGEGIGHFFTINFIVDD